MWVFGDIKRCCVPEILAQHFRFYDARVQPNRSYPAWSKFVGQGPGQGHNSPLCRTVGSHLLFYLTAPTRDEVNNNSTLPTYHRRNEIAYDIHDANNICIYLV